MPREENYYQILEVEPDADYESIRQAYQRARKTYALDSVSAYSLFTENDLKQILEKVEQAYLVLSDPMKRKAYDIAKGFVKPEATPVTVTVESRVAATAGGDVVSFAAPKVSHDSSRSEKPKEGESQGHLKIASSLPDAFFVATKKDEPQYVVDPELEEWIKTCEEFNGEVLRKIRIYKGFELAQLAENIKISKRHLENIELENFKELPATPYLRGFVVQFAKALKLDSNKVANSYMSRVKR